MSYDEHLISMAGGDGEPEPLDLDAMQGRWDLAQRTLANDQRLVSISQLHRLHESANDVPALLALVRDLEARLGRVEAVHKPKSWTKYGIPCFDEFDSPTARINGCTCGNEHYPCPTIAALDATP